MSALSKSQPSLLTSVPDILWPAIPTPHGAALLSLVAQFERNQWLPPERLKQQQSRQLDSVLDHALRTCPYYQDAFKSAGYRGGAITEAMWTALPLLTRKHLHDHGQEMLSRALPEAHGGISVVSTSGSCGYPVQVVSPQVSGLCWEAMTIYEHLLHGRDLSTKQVFIKFVEDRSKARPPQSKIKSSCRSAGTITWHKNSRRPSA